MSDGLLDFERRIHLLETRIEELCRVQAAADLDLEDEIRELRAKVDTLWQGAYGSLSPWQITQVARHPQRPHTLDYLEHICEDFFELHGDRQFADDPALVGGVARLDDRAVMVLGHQKGRDTMDRAHRNFGMPRPEGYRKARRLMATAQRLGLPVISLIDTPGAFPGVDAEARGQSAAIGECLLAMAELTVPTVAVVIGEGGSGGALAIGVADTLCMLQYATYSVISPEGCAAILWRDAGNAEQAADALAITSRRLAGLGLVDRIVPEPAGGAHRDPALAADFLRRGLLRALAQLERRPAADRLASRQARLRRLGASAVAAA